MWKHFNVRLNKKAAQAFQETREQIGRPSA